jgi:hypothetical protein
MWARIAYVGKNAPGCLWNSAEPPGDIFDKMVARIRVDRCYMLCHTQLSTALGRQRANVSPIKQNVAFEHSTTRDAALASGRLKNIGARPSQTVRGWFLRPDRDRGFRSATELRSMHLAEWPIHKALRSLAVLRKPLVCRELCPARFQDGLARCAAGVGRALSSPMAYKRLDDRTRLSSARGLDSRTLTRNLALVRTEKLTPMSSAISNARA